MYEIIYREKQDLQALLYQRIGLTEHDAKEGLEPEDFDPVYPRGMNLSALRRMAAKKIKDQDSAKNPDVVIAKNSDLTPDEQIFQQELNRQNGNDV